MWHQAVGFIGTNMLRHISQDTNPEMTQDSTMKMEAAGSSSKSLVHIYQPNNSPSLFINNFDQQQVYCKSLWGRGCDCRTEEISWNTAKQSLKNLIKLMEQTSRFKAWELMLSTTYWLGKGSFVQTIWHVNTNQENNRLQGSQKKPCNLIHLYTWYYWSPRGRS
jgi:hypothetical protein